MDPSDFDPRESIISPADIPMASNPASPPFNFQQQAQARAQAQAYSQSQSLPQPLRQQQIPRSYVCLYPVYFDKTRTRAEGRKVSSKLAVANPLAREIVDAVQMLGLKTGLEPEKMHPKDWANPGRVRAMLKDENGKPVTSSVKNSKPPLVVVLLLSSTSPRYILTCSPNCRTSSLRAGRAVSAATPNTQTDTIPPSYRRTSRSQRTPTCTRSTSWVEDWQYPPITLPGIDWWWYLRQSLEGYNGRTRAIRDDAGNGERGR